jgi:MFS family permease
MLRIERRHLEEASDAGIVTREQADRLWAFLVERVAAAPAASEHGPRFTLTNVLYYLGGMLAIGAMSLFMTLGWEGFGGLGVFFIALLYIGVALLLARRFERQGLAIPMGIMAALAVVLVPLAVWGLQHALGLWADAKGAEHYRQYHDVIDWRWVTLELATLLAGVLMLYRWRAPFLLMPVAVTLWYMSMDLALLLLPPDVKPWSESEWLFRKWFSVAFGLVTVLVAFWVDLRSRRTLDYAFWLYLFGLLVFWGGLGSLGSDRLAGKLVYLAINLGLVLIGAVLVRRAFTVFGAIGVATVLADISWRYFKESWLFPIALTAIGLAVVYLGIWWSRNETRFARGLQALLPADLRELIASRRASLGR